ncbi:META domain-containing protein [Nocardioides zhouii]|nr:META domain-containing protein [Nocardioides zhouii]
MGVRQGLGAVALVFGLAVAGGSAAGGEADVDLGGTWVLVAGRTAAGPLAVSRYAHVTLTFDADNLGGKGACNDYGADYELDGHSFDVIGPGIEQTSMGCSEEQEALDSAYFSALTGADAVARDGDTLTMTGEDVELELRLVAPWPRAEVVDKLWRLATWTDDAGVVHRPAWKPGLRPFIRFDDNGGASGRISASTGCRVLEGRWRMSRGAPYIARAEWRGDCPDRLMDQEMAINSVLSEPVLDVRTGDRGPKLVIRYAHVNGPAKVVYRH